MEGDCNVYAHSLLWMCPTRPDRYNAKMVDSLSYPLSILVIGWGGGEWGGGKRERSTLILRHTGMCHSNGSLFHKKSRKKYTSSPRYWNVPVLVNTGTFLVFQYCLKMWYLRSLECAGVIKLTILEHKNGLVLSNTCVPVSGTWSILFPKILNTGPHFLQTYP